MKSQRSLAPLLGIAAALASLFVIVSVLTGSGNHLASLCRYLLVAGFLAGLLFPRGMLFVWLVLCGYTDLLKRLMIVFGNVQYSDLYNVLGIPPMMLCGITLAVLAGAMTGRFQLSKMHWRLFAAACALMMISAVLAAREKGGALTTIVPAIANDGTYTMLLFVVPVLFQNTDDLLKIVKVLLWAYVPVSLYGIYQLMHGFQDFEIAYLKTGLSLEIKQLWAGEVRPFSTLNSPTAFSVLCGMLCAGSLMLTFIPRRESRKPMLGRTQALMLAMIFFAGLIASTSRSAILLVVLACGGFLCFRSRQATGWLYAGMGVAFVTLVLMADIIMGNLDVVQNQITDVIGEGDVANKISRVGTFSDRLHGFANLVTNPEVYTLFGYGPERGSDERDPLYSHDMISNMLVTHGVVPFLAIAIAGGFVLSRMHRRVFRLEDRHHRLLAAGFLSLAFSIIPLSAVSGSVIGTFPVNTMMWLCFALLMLVYQSDSLQRAAALEEPAATPEPAAPLGPRVVHRFTRSGFVAPERR